MKLGITGFPLRFTKSPSLHRRFLKKARLNGSYDVLPFDPAKGKRAFFRFLDELAAQGLVGVNVTIPHKEWAFEYAQKRGGCISGFAGRCAKLVGAANTLIFAGRAWCANTDAEGLWDDVREAFKLRGRFDIIIIGTGGAARGAIAGILSGHRTAANAGQVQIVGRNAKLRRELARFVAKRSRGQKAAGEVLVLWCIPKVRKREVRAIWEQVLGLAADRKIFLYDLNYGGNADSTKGLVPPARRCSGMGMLRRQARASFQLWLRASR